MKTLTGWKDLDRTQQVAVLDGYLTTLRDTILNNHNNIDDVILGFDRKHLEVRDAKENLLQVRPEIVELNWNFTVKYISPVIKTGE